MNKEIGYAIRNRRKDLRITQKELAEKIDCNYATVCSMEKGERVTSIYIFRALDVLGLKLEIKIKD